MELSIGQLLTAGLSFNRGINLDQEIGRDVLVAILSPKKSIPYYRRFGTMVKDRLNKPNNLVTQTLLIKDIVESVMSHNDSVLNSRFERSVVLGPQTGVNFSGENVSGGDLDATVLYTQVKDLQPVRVPV